MLTVFTLNRDLSEVIHEIVPIMFGEFQAIQPLVMVMLTFLNVFYNSAWTSKSDPQQCKFNSTTPPKKKKKTIQYKYHNRKVKMSIFKKYRFETTVIPVRQNSAMWKTKSILYTQRFGRNQGFPKTP